MVSYGNKLNQESANKYCQIVKLNYGSREVHFFLTSSDPVKFVCRQQLPIVTDSRLMSITGNQ